MSAKQNSERLHTSTVVTLIPAGFHRFLFQPSTHIAPKLRSETVPSPSPILTPFRIYAERCHGELFNSCANKPWDVIVRSYNLYRSNFVQRPRLVAGSCSAPKKW